MTLKTLLAPSLLAMMIALSGCGQNTSSDSRVGDDARTGSDSIVADTPEAQPGTGLPPIEVSAEELEGNPFIGEWDTPFGVPPFAEIEEDDFMPAFRQGIVELRADIEAITSNPEPATFENTILPLETSGELLNRVALTFFNLVGTERTEGLEALQSELSPMLSREQDAVSFNPVLFQRVQAVHDQLDELDLGEQERRLVELTYRDFVRAGAALTPEQRAEVAEINARLSELTTQFGQNLVRATNGYRMVIEDEAELAGLSPEFRSAIQTGETRWEVGLSRSAFETFMTQSENRERRAELFEAYRTVASSGELDNGPVLIEIAQLRARRAEVLGYDSHAHYQLETRMAQTPEAAEEFLLRVWRPGLERAREERAAMQEMIGDDFTFAGHDWWHYAERVRQERYAFDDMALAPYFELGAVQAGAFEMAGRLFNVSFEPVDVTGWNEVVTSFNVIDNETGDTLGLFMTDMYARDSKRGGAWMSTYRSASNMNGENIRPIVTNNLNLTRPPEGEPTLMRFDEVETLFHEFGHGLHGLLTQIDYPRFSGVDGPRDYTEFPAQILEHWASQPEMLEIYALHHETGEVIPTELIVRMNEASTFNQGFKTTEFIAASLLDLAWHSLSHEEALAITDARAFEREVLEGYGILPEIEPRYRSQYFAHIFAGGYSAGYYAYLWSEILDADGFYAFKEAGDIFDPELAERLKTWVYESGGLRPADELYRNFRGSDPSIEPLLEIRGFGETEQEG